MIHDLFYVVALVVYAICAFETGAAYLDPDDTDGRKAARCIFWPLTIFWFLVLMFLGVMN